ncbi:NAD(P)/FAD-dependent oxidoreductase [Nocardia uniformis]|uniref:NAD(P)/FAD-dependent oxidoreductase n=1 Tax=Nocardia uniformis TaxID=53432 RepID=A0A849C8R9_9NOCA|nr:NAD(P)/FAD-dependent oxidoreductase [Nocardia uniformis]NNH72685.1 NAD(P)/FAD-dependent oxidoreductase [Nocardia uniformis]
MTVEEVDAVVIGLGPGGEDAATRLAKAGLSVIGVEGRLVGGECPYYACIPTKMMVRAAGVVAEARRMDALAGSATVRHDWRPVATRIRDEATDNWNDAAAVERFEKAGGRFVRGWGRISAPGEVTVDTADGPRVFRAERAIVLNPGTAPVVPAIPGLADTPYWTNRDAVAATEAPESMIVLGGGPVACEFAQVFARFGTAVTMLVRSRMVPRDEPEAAELLAEVFAAQGIRVRTGITPNRVDHDGVRFIVHTDDDVHYAQHMLVATGRHTDLSGLGVGAIGLDEKAKGIEVDDHMRAAEKVWAIGDVTGKGAFTHVSMYQARIAANDILGDITESGEYHAVPRVTFTDPEVGAVGMTEAQAREAGLSVRVGRTDIAASTRGWIHKVGNQGFIKLIEDADRGILVGATSVGPCGGEVLSALAVAVHAEVPVRTLRRMIYAYPTFHRAIETALEDLS